ncbi:hypothetical protein [Flavobacterium sp. 3-210]
MNSETLEEIYELIHIFKNHFYLNFIEIFGLNSSFYGSNKEKVIAVCALCTRLLEQLVEEKYQLLYKNADHDGHIDILEQLEEYLKFVRDFISRNISIVYDHLYVPDWNQVAEQNYLNQLTGSGEMHTDQDNEDADPYLDYYDDEDLYDYENERISAGQHTAGIQNWLDEAGDLPF